MPGRVPGPHGGAAARGVAVWDVLRLCRRQGSLDSAIEPDSMVANDFGTLFDAYPTIERVYFNGAAAEKNFGGWPRESALQVPRLPSTSPAQTMRYEEKLAAWRVVATSRRRRATVGPRPRRFDLRAERQQCRLVEWPAHQLD